MKKILIFTFLIVLSGYTFGQYDKTQAQIKDYIYLKFRPTVSKLDVTGITMYTMLNYLNENKCHVPCAVSTGGADSLYVKYSCLSGSDGFLFSGDTLFINTCYADIADSSKWDVSGTYLFPKSYATRLTGLGMNTPTEVLDVNGNINIPVTTSSVGIIKQGGVQKFHTYSDNPAIFNTFIGGAGNFTMTGNSNVGIGQGAFDEATMAEFCVAIGENALDDQTEQGYNIAIGKTSQQESTESFHNVSIGVASLTTNNTGPYNIAIGGLAMTGGGLTNYVTGNVAVGYQALQDIGEQANYNIAVGQGSLARNGGNRGSVAIGYLAMVNADSRASGRQTYNTAVGYEAMKGSATAANNIGQYNTAIGHGAFSGQTSGYKNFAGGYNSFATGTTGYNNTFTGAESGDGMTTGHDNSASGFNSMSVSSGAVAAYNNTAFGTDAGCWTGYTPYQNVSIGGSTGGAMNGSNVTYQSYKNIFVGYGAGNQAANSTTSLIRSNIFIGDYAGRRAGAGASLSPTYNIAIGELAFGDYDGAHSTNGDHNISIGNWTLQNVTDADSNIVIGDSTGYNLTTGNNNIYIGVGVGKTQTTESNKIRIGQDDLIEGDVSTDVLTINGDLDMSDNNIDAADTITVQDLNMTDPTLWMDNFRQRPFYMTDFFWNSSAYIDPWAAVAVATGTIAGTGTANHPGQLIITSSTTTNSGEYITTRPYMIILQGDEISTCIIKPVVLDSVTTRFGFHDAASITAPVDGVYFEVGPDSVCVGKTMNNSTGSTTGTSYTMTDGVWYRLKVVVNSDATRIDYYIYNEAGDQLWTDNLTTNIPTSRNTGNGIISTKEHTGTGVGIAILNIDYMDVYLGTLIR